MRPARALSQIWQSNFVGNAHVLLHPNFRPNPKILATTFRCKTANSCEPPTKLQSFYCGPYGPKLWYIWIRSIFQLYHNSNFPLLNYASNVPCFTQVCAALKCDFIATLSFSWKMLASSLALSMHAVACAVDYHLSNEFFPSFWKALE